MSKVTDDLDVWRAETLEQWTDEKIWSAAQVDSALWFFCHAYADWNQVEAEVQGYSFSQKQGDWLLTVRLEKDGLRWVVFTWSVDPIHCIEKLRKSIRRGSLEFKKDRFA